MSICNNCGNENYGRFSIFYTKEGSVENCKYCPSKFVPEPIQSLFVKYVGGAPGTRRTVAHDNDISRRRVDNVTGMVYRDYNKRNFSVNGLK